MKRLLALSSAIFILLPAIGQVKLSGTIIDSKSKENISYANISLLKQDSTFVSAVSSDENGQFLFDNLSTGNYILASSLLGYEKQYQSIVVKKENANETIELAPSSVALKEVTITGQTIIQKADRKLIIPSASQIRSSNNGLTLLKNLQLSRINIDPINNTINVPGGGVVQLRINGVEVTLNEIKALSPADIVRIEYHDSPGLRYGNAAAVLDYITRHRETGGSMMANATNSIFEKLTFGENSFSGKVNNKKSEFSINGNWSLRGITWNRENTEKFVFPDKIIERKEVGMPTRFDQNVLYYAANYNLNNPEKYMLNVNLRNNYQYMPNSFSDRNSTMYSSNNSVSHLVSDHSTLQENAPALDIYYQQNLKKDQLLILNAVGTYINTHSTRSYKEMENETPLTDIFSRVNGSKYSLILEAIYEKTLKNGKLTSGIKHTQSFTNNEYTGNVTADVNLHFAETYLYAEYMLRRNKFNYTLGLGVSRNYTSQKGVGEDSYILRPNLKVKYNINDNAYITYEANLSSYPPSLSELNDVIQNIDSLQIRKGNPDLKSVWMTNNTITAGYHKNIIGVDLYASYIFHHKPMMEDISFNGEKFVHTTINQDQMHQLYTELTFSLKPFKDYLSLSFTPSFNRYISKGIDYTHTYSYWRTRISATFNYKNYVVGIDAHSRYNNLWGEDKQYGENFHTVNLGYVSPKWSVMGILFNPFSKRYDQSSENLSKLASNTSYVYSDNLARTFAIQFTMNLNFGRKFNAGDKRLNNSDSNSGIMSGTKK